MKTKISILTILFSILFAFTVQGQQTWQQWFALGDALPYFSNGGILYTNENVVYQDIISDIIYIKKDQVFSIGIGLGIDDNPQIWSGMNTAYYWNVSVNGNLDSLEVSTSTSDFPSGSYLCINGIESIAEVNVGDTVILQNMVDDGLPVPTTYPIIFVIIDDIAACGSYTWNDSIYTESADLSYTNFDDQSIYYYAPYNFEYTETVYLTIDQMPDATIVTQDTTICAGATLELSTETPNGIWSDEVTNNTFSSSTEGEFTITYTVTNGECSDTDAINITVDICNSISQFKSEVKIYPNPTRGVLTINDPSNSDFVIFNSNGQIIKNVQSENSATISLRELPSGIYYLRMLDGTTHKIFKD
ncbi:MAG: T9SS type A sorting domain-containing protein [Methanolobus sp.]|nr:T9SS type A sorting domain-containing protein [Methanolobus sp.]